MKSIKINYIILKIVYKVYLKWAKIYRVIFAFRKYKLIYFTRRLKRFNIKTVIDLGVTIIELKGNI